MKNAYILNIKLVCQVFNRSVDILQDILQDFPFSLFFLAVGALWNAGENKKYFYWFLVNDSYHFMEPTQYPASAFFILLIVNNKKHYFVR